MIALDSVIGVSSQVTFRDVNNKEDAWQRIPIKGGRGIVVVDDIDKVVVTDHCLAVCCREFALWVM